MFLFLSTTYLQDLYRTGISIALLIQSLDLFVRLIPSGAWVHGVLAFLHTYKISIAFANRSVEGSTIALAIHSLDPSGAFRGWCAGDLYRPP